jgi:hypothetical protein
MHRRKRQGRKAAEQEQEAQASLAVILSTVERGFAAVVEDITDIKNKMATKDDLAAIETRLDRRFNNSTQNSIASTPSWANSKTAKSTSGSNSKSASPISRSISA